MDKERQTPDETENEPKRVADIAFKRIKKDAEAAIANQTASYPSYQYSIPPLSIQSDIPKEEKWIKFEESLNPATSYRGKVREHLYKKYGLFTDENHQDLNHLPWEKIVADEFTTYYICSAPGTEGVYMVRTERKNPENSTTLSETTLVSSDVRKLRMLILKPHLIRQRKQEEK